MICIAWDGFPQYGARCVRALVESLGDEKVVVVGRRPAVPDKGMEDVCGCPVIWIDEGEGRGIAEICGEMPRFIFLPGWKLPIYDRWRDEVRAAGGIAACGSDNNFPLDGGVLSLHGLLSAVKTILSAIRFRLFRKGKYDGVFVPGKSGRRLFRFYGMENERIVDGLYSADASLYFNGESLAARRKRIIYVGQFIKRKNVIRMVKAFAMAARKTGGGWTLELYGSGALRDELDGLAKRVNDVMSASSSCVVINSFAPPEKLADLYRKARVFCLPSLEEHWGLVVHEAALSGCILLLSKAVGAASDLLGKKIGSGLYSNGRTFNPYSTGDIARAMVAAMSMDDESLLAAQQTSLARAGAVSIARFVNGVHALMSLRRR